MSGNGFTLAGEQQTRHFQFVQWKYALKLEIAGLKHSRGSVYAHVKRHFGWKGNKQKIYDKLCAFIAENEAKIAEG